MYRQDIWTDEQADEVNRHRQTTQRNVCRHITGRQSINTYFRLSVGVLINLLIHFTRHAITHKTVFPMDIIFSDFCQNPTQHQLNITQVEV